jgi:hypothetical protein
MNSKIATVATACLIVGVALLLAQPVPEPTPPYSISYRETASWIGHNNWPDHVREFFRGARPDGSTVERHNIPNGGHQTNVKLTQAGLTIMRNDKSKLVTIFGDGKPKGAFVVKDCVAQLPLWNVTNAKEESFLGFRVLHGTGISEVEDYEGWYAPDLGCTLLKQIHYWKTDGKRDGRVTTLEAISASAAQPPDEEFALPGPDSVEVKPSEYNQQVFKGKANGNMSKLDSIWDTNKAARQK